MQGEIKKFREDIGFGVILAEDGRKFRFAGSDILNRDEICEGREVDFVVLGLTPQRIIVISGSPWTAFGGLAA